ncbi:MAG: tagaturonate epimerase family protein, partial [Balneolales bacterium]
LMVRAGYTMLTIDPSEYVINEASGYGKDELLKRSAELPWKDLQSSQDRFISAYNGKTFFISDDFHIKPTESEVLQALVKYGGVVAHTSRLHNHLKSNWPDHPVEIELSIDETDSPTTLFEHYMIVSELKRLGIALTGIAPRFVGDFEKGIDYKGDPGHFKDEYVRHLGIANKLGPYKISIHSGSDKFGVYEVIGSLKQGHVHVKTAGTSYLEALRTVAAADPGLFGEILDFSRAKFKTDRQTYHISADLTKVPEAGRCSTTELFGLLDQDDARQVLHVTFGSVL